MILVVNQTQTEKYLIEYFHLFHDMNYNVYFMIGLARLNLTETKLVHLAIYSSYKQAIKVFADMNYMDNDLMYFKERKKIFYMPANIVDGQEMPIYIDYDLVKPINLLKGEYKYVIGTSNYIEDHVLHIRNKTYIEDHIIKIPEEEIL